MTYIPLNTLCRHCGRARGTHSVLTAACQTVAGMFDHTKQFKAAAAINEKQAPVAPWPDFAGRPITHGDRLAHPDGTTFVAVFLAGHLGVNEAWRAVYDDQPHGAPSSLGLQIGDKGRAVVVEHHE